MADDLHLFALRGEPADAGPAAALAELAEGSNAAAARLEPGDDPRALLPWIGTLRLIEIGFPKFRDGRGYSQAQILREMGFAGELRAVGDINPDQLQFLLRVGFDSVAADAPLDPALVSRTLARYAHVYMGAADGRAPAFTERGRAAG